MPTFRFLTTPLVLLVAAAVWLTLLVAATPARAALPLEDYAPYQPQTRCSPVAKPGTLALRAWTVRHFGGSAGGISRPCGGSGSEHKEGRAFDWSVDARRASDRRRVHRFLVTLFAEDAEGNADALARRMGIMYVIWNDRIWSAWNGFQAEPYLNSACKSLRRCSRTLRHRNHVHVSITKPAARGQTSWYYGRV